ncbi:hypothetical protein [Nesterenkonia rhizosphaerae]|uniref:Uncharacterized protein n=1 Tax=Nesterenkonia rhizosphaerae TaxID=1348272 RepID=A0ABP9FZZ5_9MICC
MLTAILHPNGTLNTLHLEEGSSLDSLSQIVGGTPQRYPLGTTGYIVNSADQSEPNAYASAILWASGNTGQAIAGPAIFIGQKPSGSITGLTQTQHSGLENAIHILRDRSQQKLPPMLIGEELALLKPFTARAFYGVPQLQPQISEIPTKRSRPIVFTAIGIFTGAAIAVAVGLSLGVSQLSPDDNEAPEESVVQERSEHIPDVDEEQVRTELEKEVEVLAERAQELDTFSESLDEREQELDRLSEEIDQRVQEVSTAEEEVARLAAESETKQAQLEERATELDQREAELDAREEATTDGEDQ